MAPTQKFYSIFGRLLKAPGWSVGQTAGDAIALISVAVAVVRSMVNWRNWTTLMFLVARFASRPADSPASRVKPAGPPKTAIWDAAASVAPVPIPPLSSPSTAVRYLPECSALWKARARLVTVTIIRIGLALKTAATPILPTNLENFSVPSSFQLKITDTRPMTPASNSGAS